MSVPHFLSLCCLYYFLCHTLHFLLLFHVLLSIGTSTWTYRPCSGSVPSVRSGHVATFVPSLSALIVHGGTYVQLDKSTGDMDMKFRSDTYKLDINTWTWSRIETDTDGPERNGHTMLLCDLVDEKEKEKDKDSQAPSHPSLILFGGSGRNGPSNQVWTLDLGMLRKISHIQYKDYASYFSSDNTHPSCN